MRIAANLGKIARYKTDELFGHFREKRLYQAHANG